MFRSILRDVVLSGAGVKRSGTPAESKHPYPRATLAGIDSTLKREWQ